MTRTVLVFQRCLALSVLAIAVLAAALASPHGAALASFPPAGTDTLPVSGEVSITSRIGQETIPLSGTATIQRAASHDESGIEVQSAELTALSLSGSSVTGSVRVSESPTAISAGELRAKQTTASYPASSYFDVYAIVTVPASPGGTTDLQNYTAIHTVAGTLLQWPPNNAVYSTTPSPCVPLLPSAPKAICITSLAFTVSGGVGGLTQLAKIDVPANGARNITAEIALAFAGLFALTAAAWWLRHLAR